MKCEYGCGQEATHQFKNGRWCCSKRIQSCQVIRKKIGISGKGKTCVIINKPKKIENFEHILCEYGCGQEAKFQFNNGRYCCSKDCHSCPYQRRKNSKSQKGRVISEQTKKKMSYSIEQWKEKYPTFSKVEEMRYNPKTGEIQVHCKNSNCKNSKENNGWFTPTKNQFGDRIRQLEYTSGNDGGYLYCCDECKQQCPLYHVKNDPYSLTDINTIPLNNELNIWRNEVLKRQKDELGYSECEYCGNKDLSKLQVHHEKPKKTHSIMSLDPDNGIILCVKKERQKEEETCHFKFGHKTGTECSTGALANKICT